MDFSFESKSSLYGRLDGTLNIDPRSLNVDGTFTVVDAGIPKFLALFPPQDKFEISKGDLGMTIRFNSQALKTLQADLKGTISGLNIGRTGKKAVIGNLDFIADLIYENSSVKIDLNKFHVDQPILEFSGKASGNLSPDLKSPGPYCIELTGKNIDIKPLRHLAITLASDVPVIPEIFKILREGRIKFLIYLLRAL